MLSYIRHKGFRTSDFFRNACATPLKSEMDGLEGSDRRLISSIGKTKKNAFISSKQIIFNFKQTNYIQFQIF